MSTTRVTQYIRAPRSRVYRTLLDPEALPRWRVPTGMSCQVHVFEPSEGGAIRVSLTYESPTERGKTTRHTDTYRGRFVKLVPNEQVVEVDEFETNNPALQGQMTITLTLRDSDGGTELIAEHEGVPPGVSPTDNETGWKMALMQLAQWIETRPQ